MKTPRHGSPVCWAWLPFWLLALLPLGGHAQAPALLAAARAHVPPTAASPVGPLPTTTAGLVYAVDSSGRVRAWPAAGPAVARYAPSQQAASLYVSVRRQRLYYLVAGQVVGQYPVSTARAGVGSAANSNQTPLGLHIIREKIGQDCPTGEIIRGGKPTGQLAPIYTDSTDVPLDYVTTRALWLDGQEASNRTSHERRIYIHGTPEEGLIGTPASHGCVRLRNADVATLFDLLPAGTYVLIGD